MVGLSMIRGMVGLNIKIKKYIHTITSSSHRRGLVVSDNGYHSMVWGFNPQ